MLRPLLLACTLVLLGVGIALADDNAPLAGTVDKTERVTLSVTPAAEPRPALKHSLWLDERQRQPGNGSTFYYRAMLLAEQRRDAERKAFPADKTKEWLTVPLSDFPQQEVGAYLEQYRHVLRELETATARETCQWDLRLDQLQGTAVIEFLLPDFQNMRDLGRLIAYKARYEAAQGKYEEALGTLRQGYQIAHDCAEPPLLINALIGVAIASMMDSVVLDMIDAPNSPNLYWALKQLPQPLIDIQPSLRFEMSIPYRVFPFLADAETAQRTPEEWHRLTQETLQNLHQLSDNRRLPDWQIRLGGAALMLKNYPVAKGQLIASGMERELIEKMPVAQVIAIQAARNYRYTYEEVFKWSLLPYPEAQPRMLLSMERLKAEGYIGNAFSDKEMLPLASLLMPAIESVLQASTRGERRQAAMETLEAVRMHAAVKGELPASLQQLAVVPAPPNPFTGEPFTYRLEGRHATLDERVPGADPARAGDRIYLLELTKE